MLSPGEVQWKSLPLSPRVRGRFGCGGTPPPARRVRRCVGSRGKQPSPGAPSPPGRPAAALHTGVSAGSRQGGDHVSVSLGAPGQPAAPETGRPASREGAPSGLSLLGARSRGDASAPPSRQRGTAGPCVLPAPSVPAGSPSSGGPRLRARFSVRTTAPGSRAQRRGTRCAPPASWRPDRVAEQTGFNAHTSQVWPGPV